MKYTFKIDDEHEVTVTITNKRPTQLVADEGMHNGVIPSWIYNHYEVKPTAAWIVDVSEPNFTTPLPDREDHQSVDAFAWQEVRDNNEAVDAILIEWPDGIVELCLPEHDIGGTEGALTVE